MALLTLVPIAIALLYRFGAEPDPGVVAEQVAINVVGGLVLTLMLPLVALVLGTGSLGAGIADGTTLFLLTKPVGRGRVVGVTMAVAAAVTMALMVPTTVLCTWLIASDPESSTAGSADATSLALGLGLTAAVAAVLYCAAFVAVSARTSRALLIGLAYVFVWEAFATNLFESLTWLSIREYAVGWSRVFVTFDPGEAVSQNMSATAAVIGSVVVVGAAVAYGTYALSRFQIPDDGG